MGPHDVILWPHPSFVSLLIQDGGPASLCHETDLNFFIETAYLQLVSGNRLVLVFSHESSLKGVGVRGEKQTPPMMGSERVSHTTRRLIPDTTAAAGFALWAFFFFSPRHKQFS